MDKIKELINRPLVVGAVAFVVGLLFGWFILGWGIAPVTWTDAAPGDLQAYYRTDYLKMAIKAYAYDKNADEARLRWQALQEYGPSELAKVQTDPTIKPQDTVDFQGAVGQAGLPIEEGQVPAEETAKPAGIAGISPVVLLVVFCLLALIILAALVYLLLLRKRSAGSGVYSTAHRAIEASRAAPRTDYAAVGQEPPVAQFMTTYMLGDDLYDDSFSIDAPSGEFLGECGVGISDTIGVGDPKKVTAFEVWLFDKNDIQTVTKVLMSQHAMNDPAIRQRLESKGEPIEIESGKSVILETATLRLEAKVVDMNYGQGALPANSFIDRLTLELAIWPKQQS